MKSRRKSPECLELEVASLPSTKNQNTDTELYKTGKNQLLDVPQELIL